MMKGKWIRSIIEHCVLAGIWIVYTVVFTLGMLMAIWIFLQMMNWLLVMTK